MIEFLFFVTIAHATIALCGVCYAEMVAIVSAIITEVLLYICLLPDELYNQICPVS